MNSSSDQAMDLPPFAVVLLIFSIWMLVDAYRRRAELYWIAIILLLPFGSVIYFVFIKLKDFTREKPTLTRGEQPAPELGELARPSAPKNPQAIVAQADGLEERGSYDEAIQRYQMVLATEPHNLFAMHGMARCLLGKKEPENAVNYLEKVVETDREFRDYSAVLDYGEALWQSGRRDDCVELLEALATHTGRFNHRIAAAHYLAESGSTAKARARLSQLLEEHTAADTATQLGNQRWAERAEQMLRDLG